MTPLVGSDASPHVQRLTNIEIVEEATDWFLVLRMDTVSGIEQSHFSRREKEDHIVSVLTLVLVTHLYGKVTGGGKSAIELGDDSAVAFAHVQQVEREKTGDATPCDPKAFDHPPSTAIRLDPLKVKAGGCAWHVLCVKPRKMMEEHL